MKKILAFGLIILFSFSLFAQAPELTDEQRAELASMNSQITVQIFKGWNLVPTFNVVSSTCEDVLEYYYLPSLKKYVSMVVSPTNQVNIDQYQRDNAEGYFYAWYGGKWRYSRQNCSITYEPSNEKYWNQASPDYLPKKIAQGWQFIAITDYLKSNNPRELFVHCSIQRMYSFNTEQNKWETKTAEELFAGNYSSLTGTILVTKFENACELNFKQPTYGDPSTADLPALPE
ncbi:MAG: hypothetical protein Q7S92_01575 [Candidatus Diapherotrites archaeon]|nr:hypothetical protein [Candidatus Diapherotrites archaeon]